MYKLTDQEFKSDFEVWKVEEQVQQLKPEHNNDNNGQFIYFHLASTFILHEYMKFKASENI